jgi:hypothetical protein
MRSIKFVEDFFSKYRLSLMVSGINAEQNRSNRKDIGIGILHAALFWTEVVSRTDSMYIFTFKWRLRSGSILILLPAQILHRRIRSFPPR